MGIRERFSQGTGNTSPELGGRISEKHRATLSRGFEMAPRWKPGLANVVLVGMPGAGKSTAGVVLAKRMNLSFLDVDLLIQQHQGRTLQTIIDDVGVDGFLKIEGDILSGIECSRTVISTGGSAIYSEEAIDHLGTTGPIVYLKVSYEELERRLDDLHERGVAFPGGGTGTLRDLFDQRCSLYENKADLAITVDGMDISQVVKVVSGRLELIDPESFAATGR